MQLSKSLFSGCFVVLSLPLEGNLTVPLRRVGKFSVTWLSCASWHTHSPMSTCRKTTNCSTLQTAPSIWHANNAAKISLLILEWPLNPEITSNNKEFIWERLDLQHGSVKSLQVSCTPHPPVHWYTGSSRQAKTFISNERAHHMAGMNYLNWPSSEHWGT